MINFIHAIEYNWWAAKEGENYQSFEVDQVYKEGLCVDISKTEEGSFVILFSSGRSLEVFNPGTIYRIPVSDKILKTKNNV